MSGNSTQCIVTGNVMTGWSAVVPIWTLGCILDITLVSGKASSYVSYLHIYLYIRCMYSSINIFFSQFYTQ